MQTLPVTIRRSLIGLIGIFIGGLLTASLIIGLALYIAPQMTPEATYLFLSIGIITIIVTLIAMVVYDATTMTLTTEGVEITTFFSLFWSDKATCEWADIEEVSVRSSGIIRRLFGVGDLFVQTASARPNLSLTWIPRSEYWGDVIREQAAVAEAAN